MHCQERSKTPSDDEILPSIVNLFKDDKQPKTNKQGVTQSPEVPERITTRAHKIREPRHLVDFVKY